MSIEHPLDSDIKQFQVQFCPYGYTDVKAAVAFFRKFDKRPGELFEHLENFCEMYGIGFDKADPCYVAYEAILQEARTALDKVLDFDIQNDAEFYTHGEYCATFYESSPGSMERLKEALFFADEDQIKMIKEMVLLQRFLQELDINLDKVIQPRPDESEYVLQDDLRQHHD